MLKSVNDLKGYDIVATDGKIGNIEEFYFDDIDFEIRYIVANTGNWLTGKQKLFSPFSVTHLDHDDRKIHLALTREQVKNAPGVDKHMPVSRQMEKIVSDYYGNTYYWEHRPDLSAAQLAATNAAVATVKSAVTTQSTASATVPPNVHLQSMRELAGYEIAALDGEIGEVADFLVEIDDWTIRYMIVDIGKWLPGRHVPIPTQWLGQINWAHRKFKVNLTRAQIEKTPVSLREFQSGTTA